MRFAIFPLHLSKESKVLCLPGKVMPGHTKALHLSRKIIFPNSKMQPLSGNQRPDLLTSLMNMSPALRLPRKMHLCRSSSIAPRLPSFLNMLQNPHVFAHFWQGAQALAPATRNDIRRQKVGQTCGVSFFQHFDFEMCLAPQRRALFRYLNFQKWSEHVAFLFNIWLRNVLRAATACTHLNFQKWSEPISFLHFWLRKVLRATTACTFRHIWTSKSAPNMRCFVHFDFEMCFALQRRAIFHLSSGRLAPHPPEPQTTGKTECFATFLPFRAPGSSFFWDFLFLFFSSLLWPAFPSVHVVGSLTSKLPSTSNKRTCPRF